MDLILRFLGLQIEDAGRVTDVSLALRGGLHAAWIILAGMILTAAVIWMYRRSGDHLSPTRKYALAALRAGLICLILLLLLRPVLSFTVEGSVRRALVMMFDNSASMRIEDPRIELDDRVRAGIALGHLDVQGGLEQPLGTEVASRLPRIDLLKAMLHNEQLRLLERLGAEYELRPFAFGSELRDLTPAAVEPPQTRRERRRAAPSYDWIDQLDARDPLTASGDALREMLARTRGQPLAGVLIAWDGGNNSGADAMAGAELARREGVPLYIYGIGITHPRDIIVSNIFAQEVAFMEDEVPVAVRVRGMGLAGETGELELLLDDRRVASQTVVFDEQEQTVTLSFTPDRPGDYELRARIEPREDESESTNNEMSQRLRVVDGKIKVLYVEQTPRWEFRYLQAALLRDRRIELKNVLLEADAALTRGEDSPYVPLPAERQELFNYDLIIFGDVDPRQFTASQLEAVHEFVEKFGGGFLKIAGRRYGPGAFRNTPIERLLPVELEAGSPGGRETAAAALRGADLMAERPVPVELTSAGRRSIMMRLADTQSDSERLWSNLPPIYWTARVGRAKPAAEVLLVDADPTRGVRNEKMPIIAHQQYGMGQVIFVGTDNTWRWRRNVADRHYTTLWGQMVQRLALPHLLGESRRTQLSSDRQHYGTGERVPLYARLYNEAYQPVLEDQMQGYYRGEDGRDVAVLLRPMPEQPGMYRGEFVAPQPGNYSFWVASDPQTRLAIEVGEPRLELAETAMNEELMRQMAVETGGAFFREEDLHRLPESIEMQADKVRSTLEVEIWSSPIYFLLMLMMVTSEWVLRKVSQLK